MNTRLKTKKQGGKDVEKGRHDVGIVKNEFFLCVTTKQAYPCVICSVSSSLATKGQKEQEQSAELREEKCFCKGDHMVMLGTRGA